MAMEPPSIALIVAMAQERRALRRRLSSIRAWRGEDCHGLAGRLLHEPIVLIQAGIGCDSARRALLAASRRFSIRGAWSLGFAGGLAEGLSPGDLVCPGVVFKDDGQTGQAFGAASVHSVAAALSAVRMPPSDGPLLSVDAPLLTPEAKRAAHRRTGAVAVDMEAAGVAEAAGRLGIPWLAIKAVVDTVDESLPRFLSGCTTPRGDLRWRGVLWSLAVGSRRRALSRLARASRPATLALQRSLEAVLFAWSP